MDSLTHIVLGAAIGEIVLGKKIGRKAMMWGALADTIPDFDVFASCCTTDAHQLLVHRGITHSFFFVFLAAPIIGWFFSKWFKKADVSWKSWTWLFFLGMFTHILIDSFTSYGTGWFEPFSSYRVSFDTIFVADVFYTIPFLICVLIAIIAKNNSSKRINFTKAGLWISSTYLLFTFINKIYVQDIMKSSFEKQNLKAEKFIATPTPLNNFLWTSYTHDEKGTYIGYYSIFDKNKDVEFKRIERNDSLLIGFENNEDVKYLKQFSKGYYVMTKDVNGIYFNDIRFGMFGGCSNIEPTFPFAFNIKREPESSTGLDRTKFKNSMKDAFFSLVDRVKGI